MAHPTKIATCCHCGSKAALTLGRGRHELSCASCGAPLRHLKMLPTRAAAPGPAISHQPRVRDLAMQPHAVETPRKASRRKRKRGGWFGKRFKDLAEDIFDVVEDIFD